MDTSDFNYNHGYTQTKCEYKAIFLENSRFSVKNTFFGDHYFGEVDVFINLQNSALQEIFYKIFLEKLT